MKHFAEIGLYGLAAMGENLALNFASHGFSVAVSNRSAGRVRDFAAGRGREGGFLFCEKPEEFCAALKMPRKIFLMVKAGPPVDAVIGELLPFLAAGDIVIDGGNSAFEDTARRETELRERKIRFVGCGVSGGEAGALHGPSLMPGGDDSAWPELREILSAIAAKAPDGTPCCAWLGSGGAGHYVKMVHNGIEYGDMQLIAEAYWLLKHLCGSSAPELARTFAAWNRTELAGYLMEITAKIFDARDESTGRPAVELILDRAGQKGTGGQAAESALRLGCASPVFADAVFARLLSADKDGRVAAAEVFPRAAELSQLSPDFPETLRRALFAAKIVAYAQGFSLLRLAGREYGWSFDLGRIARLWRGGCIIRAAFLDRVSEAFAAGPELENLLFSPYFAAAVRSGLPAWREAVCTAVRFGLAVPVFSGTLQWFDGWTSAELPANLIQAQRDFFGAHTFERIDAPRGRFFHRVWGA